MWSIIWNRLLGSFLLTWSCYSRERYDLGFYLSKAIIVFLDTCIQLFHGFCSFFSFSDTSEKYIFSGHRLMVNNRPTYESNNYMLSSKYLYQKILLIMYTFFQWLISLHSLENSLFIDAAIFITVCLKLGS